MKRVGKAVTVLVLVLAVLLLGVSVVITYPDEYQLIRQFGEIVRVGYLLRFRLCRIARQFLKSCRFMIFPSQM